MKITFLTQKRTPPISLYLHIGMPKTGSTAIQDYFAFNRDVLKRKQNTVYPECGVPVNQHTALVKSIVRPMFDWTHFNSAIETFDPERYINDIIQQCRDNRCSKVILSSEFFWASPAMQAGPRYHSASRENFDVLQEVVKRCRDLFAGFDEIKIIIYLRNQEDWLDSFYNQQLKDGFDIPDSEEIVQEEKIFLLYHQNIAIWSSYFGKENIIVRNFARIDQDIISDFLDATGLKRKTLHEPPRQDKSANTRLSASSAQIMRTAIRMKLNPETLALFKQVLQETSHNHYLAGHRFHHTLFDDNFYRKIRLLYHKDNMNLARDYCELLPDAAASSCSTQKVQPAPTEELLSRLLSR